MMKMLVRANNFIINKKYHYVHKSIYLESLYFKLNFDGFFFNFVEIYKNVVDILENFVETRNLSRN